MVPLFKDQIANINTCSSIDHDCIVNDYCHVYYTPAIVRNGKKATVGYQPDVWKGWD